MSLVINQQPDAMSLSSMVKDFILTATENVNFEFKFGLITILSETYSPDADGKIYIRDLGIVCRDFLPGDVLFVDSVPIISGIQSRTFGLFQAIFNGVTVVEFNVSRCDAYSKSLNYPVLRSGKNTRLTSMLSKEYLTGFLNEDLMMWKLSVVNNVLTATNEVVYLAHTTGAIRTVNVSFDLVANNGWNMNDYVGYRLRTSAFTIDYMLDYTYLYGIKFLDCFLYKNAFGVNETFSVLMPDTKRKVAVTSETALINREKHKYNTRRADTYEVNVGILRTEDEYIRMREMFSSEEIYIWVTDEWLPIVITDIKDENPELLAHVGLISFTYQFSNDKHNIRL